MDFSKIRLPPVAPDRSLPHPIGATITTGRKDGRGIPTEKERYFIQSARADGSGQAGRRYFHTDFAPFNGGPNVKPTDSDMDAAELKKIQDSNEAIRKAHNITRAALRGVIVHARQEDCHEHRLQAYILTAGKQYGPEEIKTPSKAPACVGNGVTAQRWDMKAGDYKEIACTKACPYKVRPESGKGQAPCTVFSRLIFQLRWPENNPLPTPLVQYATKALEGADNIEALFAHVKDQAKNLGIDNIDFYGLPFRMTLEARTGTGSRYGVSTFTTDFAPGQNLQSWLVQKAERAQLLQDRRRYLTIGSPEVQALLPDVVEDLIVGNGANS